MELGQRIRQARQEAGLSQRQLCQDLITRNMLSQIENGSAKPSMDTLQSLAARLGKTVGYFLDEPRSKLPNQAVLERARQAAGLEQLQILEEYQGPDPVFDPERWFMEVLTCLELAQKAIVEEKITFARSLLDRAKAAGEQTPYYTEYIRRQWLLLCFEAGLPARELAPQLPSEDPTLLLLAGDALERKDAQAAGRYLDAAQEQTPKWHYLRAVAWEEQADYDRAITHYLQAQETVQVLSALERCYLAKGDYKQAYFYACKQRESGL